ncbi:hypothetical protein ACHWQZ_G018326 [Mnemiopsis leidyi]
MATTTMINSTEFPTTSSMMTGIPDSWHESLISALVAVCGTLFNSLSLLYFIKHDSEQLGSKLLILLNVFDLCVCTSSALTVFLELHNSARGPIESVSYALDVLLAVYVVAGESTAFSTCLLSVVRCWCLSLPFNRVTTRSLVRSTFCFLLYIVSREAAFVVLTWTCQDYHGCGLATFEVVRHYLTIGSMSIIIFLVVVSNAISIKKVISSRGSEDLVEVTKRAAVTVLLVSANFCLYNTSFIVLFCYFLKIPHAQARGNKTIRVLEYLTYRVFLPMNSATNPLIYLVRKLEMRQFVLGLLNRMRLFFVPDCGGQIDTDHSHTEELVNLTTSKIAD